MSETSPSLRMEFGGLVLKNPVMTASGTFGYGTEFVPFLDLSQLGALVVKGISLEPRQGNKPPRTAETPCGMINAIGLENVGLDRFLSEKLPALQSFDVPVVVNILGEEKDEYVRLAERLGEASGVSAIELNVSCPNVRAGGRLFGLDPQALENLVSAVRKTTRLPLWVKLTPLVTDITAMGKAARQGGADALCIGNTFPAMVVDVKTRRPKLGNVIGGLSGPAIRPIMVRLCRLLAESSELPIIGIGGITRAEDALEYILAGASAVQVGTANFTNPRATMDILTGLRTYLEENRIPGLSNLVGGLITD